MLTIDELLYTTQFTGSRATNWTQTGRQVCAEDHAYVLHLALIGLSWSRSVVEMSGVWVGTVAEFPEVHVEATTEVEANRLLTTAISLAIRDRVNAGEPIPTPPP